MTRAIVRVRPAEATDAAVLGALVRSVDPVVSARGGHDEPGRFADRVAAVIADPARVVLVATDHEDAVAGVLVARRDDIGSIDVTPALHVTHLVVTADRRRRGAGRALLTAAVQLAEADGLEHLAATVPAGSREGNRYLARLGFAPVVVHRVVGVGVLRRALGLTDPGARVARLRRARMVRANRSGPVRALGRGA